MRFSSRSRTADPLRRMAKSVTFSGLNGSKTHYTMFLYWARFDTFGLKVWVSLLILLSCTVLKVHLRTLPFVVARWSRTTWSVGHTAAWFSSRFPSLCASTFSTGEAIPFVIWFRPRNLSCLQRRQTSAAMSWNLSRRIDEPHAASAHGMAEEVQPFSCELPVYSPGSTSKGMKAVSS